MDRKNFLKTLGGCCGLVSIASGQTASQATTAPAQGAPCEKKYQFSQTWVKRFMDIVDKQLDEPTRVKLMQEQGRLCFESSHGPAPSTPPKPDDLDKLIARMKKFGGDEMIRSEGDVIHFQYMSGPPAQRPAETLCLCPLVEKGPEGLSGTYCECSIGYVRQMFQRASVRPVKVELLESLKRGGKACNFRIQVV